MQGKSGGKQTDDDNCISDNFVGLCIVISRDYTGVDEKGANEPQILIDLVFCRCDFADLCDISAGDSVFYTADGCVLGCERGILYRRMFPDFDCIITDIDRFRSVGAHSDSGADAGNSGKACTGAGKENGADGA